MNEAEMRAIFLLAGIPVEKAFKLANNYWPEVPEYEKLRAESPWWLAKTPNGMIQIGWRKRVIAIDWSDTGIKATVTKDEVTISETDVHAWTYAKAVEYMAELRRAFEKAAYVASVPVEAQ